MEKQKSQSQFLNVSDVKKICGVAQAKAYNIIRDLNLELKKQGYITLEGKINRKFFEEKFYLDKE